MEADFNGSKCQLPQEFAAEPLSWRRPLRQRAFEPYWKHTHSASAYLFILHRQESQALTSEYVNMQMKCKVSL